MSAIKKTNGELRFMDELVLRTPALSFIPMDDAAITERLLQDETFLEAIYLASPVLHAACIRMKNGQLTDAKEIIKIRISLAKYYQRMYSRCTPFGLFSGCSLVQWDSRSGKVVLPSGNFLRSTRLDMHYLCALGQHLSSLPFIRQRLRYYPNNSYYKMGDELRYIEYRYIQGKRVHQISSVLYSEYIQWVLDHAGAGATPASLIQLLVQQAEVEEEEAAEFVDEMITSQVLISEMDPAITGEEFIHQLLRVLQKINEPADENIQSIIRQLEKMVQTLDDLDQQLHQPSLSYQSLIDQVKEAGVAFEENKLLQVDMYSAPVQNTVQKNWQEDLLKAVDLLARIFPPVANETLASFAERFRSRYEDQAMPLLQVLDAETGIGYTERSGRNLSPLLDNIAMPSQRDRDSYDIKWNKTEQWLFQLLISNRDNHEVILDEKLVKEFEDATVAFPPSQSVMFSQAEGDAIVFRGCSGSSAANLLGRFAHADQHIRELVLKITAEEQAMNPAVHFAEIIHLPEDRVGNILLHPAFREYEIPFLAQSSLPAEQQISLQDLLISVSQDKQVRLFSRKLGKEIIPRLSNAHNYSYASLPVYHFLADLQLQGLVGGLNFSWGSMTRQFRFLPRVKYQNIILFEATWQLRKEDMEPLLLQQEWNADAVDLFRQNWKMPRMMVLADGDNELLVDLHNQLSVETFISTIRNRDLVVLKEFILPGHAVVDDQNRPYNNQLVAVLMNNGQVYAKNSGFVPLVENTATARKFMPGSEWLYYKLYCGTKTADELLTRYIHPLTESWLQQGKIDQWFFIRYNDPGFHLRLRFHIPEAGNLGGVMQQFLQAMEEPNREGLIASVQADTYNRELERYGQALVVLAEALFFTDSKMKLEFLQLTEGDEREKLRWPWAMRGVDELLNAFQLNLTEKYELMQSFQQSFAAEFNADKQLFRQLNQQYNEHRTTIQLAMQNPVSADNVYQPLLDIFNRYNKELSTVAGAILQELNKEKQQAALQGLLSGYVHMNLNRLFLSEPRQHELLIYDFLCSWYRSQLKRN